MCVWDNLPHIYGIIIYIPYYILTLSITKYILTYTCKLEKEKQKKL